MKKLLLAALWLPLMALAQTYPSPTYNNVTVLGTLTGKVNSTGSTITNATITGGTISGLSSPLPVASGGTNSASASGTALDNIAGFAGTGFMSRTGAGAYSFTASTGSGSVVQATSPTIASPTITGALTATGLVTTADLAAQAANTVLANATGSSASPTAFAMPGCSSSSSALQWTSGAGFGCNASINATTLGGTAAASYALLASPAFSGTPTSPTASFNTNTTQIATTAFAKSQGFEYTPIAGTALGSNTTLTAAQANGWFTFNSTGITATLPAVSGVPFGNTYTFRGASTGGTVAASGADTISTATNASVSSLYVPVGYTAVFESNSSGWFITSYGRSNRTSDCNDIVDFGGVNDGSTDNLAAFNRAKVAGPSQRQCVYFGPGKWYMSGAASMTSSTTSPTSFTILGAGQDLTELSFAASNNGINITLDGQYNSAHVRDLTVTTQSACSTCSGIIFQQSPTTIANPANSALSDITNVTIRGSDGYAATNYWNSGVLNIGVSNVNYTNMMAIGPSGQLGVGVAFTGGTSTRNPVQFNFQGCMFYALNNGIEIESSYYQGITVSQSNFTANASAGVAVDSGLTGFDQMTIIGNQFANRYGVYILSQFQNLMVAHNLFIEQNIAGVYGIYNNAAVLFSYIGNTFQNANAPTLTNNPVGIYNNNDSGVGGIISGNVIRYLSPAIRLDTSTTGENVQSNAYFNNNTNVSNGGTGNTVGGGSQ